MTTIEIYRLGRATPITLDIDERTVYAKKLQGEHRITSEVIHSSASGLDLTIGDYITYPASGLWNTASGENYTINRLPTVTKINNSTFKYNIAFEANKYNLNKKILISSDELADFSYNGSPTDFLDLILSNINEIDPTWIAASGNTSGTDKTLQFVNESCLSALGKVAEAYNFEHDINDRTISLKSAISGASGYTFKYGEASGLYKLERQQVLNQNIITRCYGFGGTQNIPYTYRSAAKRLTFSASGMAASGYLDSSSAQALYGIIEGQYTDDTIYPKRTGTLTAVSFAASGTGAWDTNTDYLVDSAMDFDINGYLLEGQTAKIVFKSGDLSGVECEIWQYTDATKKFYITPFTDADAAIRPDSVNYPAVGDSYTIVNISMPQSYVDTAEASLKAATQAWLDKYSVPQVVYNIDIDPKHAASIGLDIKVGDRVTIVDSDLSIDSLIRISGIEFPLVNTYKIKATIADFVPYTMQERIIKSAISNSQQTITGDKTNTELIRLNAVNQNTIKADYATLESPTFTGIITIPSLIVTDLTDGYLPYQVAGTDELGDSPVFTDGDKVGIGVTPNAKFHVYESAALGAASGNYQLLIEIGSAVGNVFKNRLWAYRDAAGSDWNTARLHDAISVDSSFGTPHVNTKVWYERDPLNNIHAWGNGASTYLMISAGNLQDPSFVAGWLGNSWQATPAGNFDIENLLVRGSARFRELVIDQLAIIAGSQLLSVARGKILSINTASSGITLDDPNDTGACAFIPEDFFWIKNVDIDNGLFSDVKGQIASVSGVNLTLSFAASGSTGAIEDITEGDVIVQRGHPSSGLRQNLIYTTVSDDDAPFQRTMTGVNSLFAFNDLNNVALQTGNLESLANHDIVPASPGYGLYSDNGYLKGLVQASSGDIGGFTINQGEGLYAGSGSTRVQMKPGAGFWAGATAIGSAPFSVNQGGVLRASSGEIGGFSITATKLSGGDIDASDFKILGRNSNYISRIQSPVDYNLNNTDYPAYCGDTGGASGVIILPAASGLSIDGKILRLINSQKGAYTIDGDGEKIYLNTSASAANFQLTEGQGITLMYVDHAQTGWYQV